MPAKTPSAIEIWRQEVSASFHSSPGPSPPTSSLSSHSNTTITPSHTSHTHQTITTPDQNLAPDSSKDIIHHPRPPPVNRTSSFWRRLLSTTKNLTFTHPSSPLASSKSNSNSIVKTGMYSTSTDQDDPPRLLGRGKPRRQSEDGDSMDLISEQSTRRGGLRAQVERLRRARRLLDGEGREMDGERIKNVARMRE